MQTEHSYKRYTIICLSFTLGLLAAAGLLVYAVDPFVHFHAPFGRLVPAETEEYYANIGVAKHMDYDTAIVGSSMTENFVPSWFENGFGESCVKLCFQGSHFSDYSLVLEQVLQKEQVKHVFFSLDNYLLTDRPEEDVQTIPDYLVSDKPFDNVNYLLNRDVLLDYTPRFLINNVRSGYSADYNYNWNTRFPSSRHAALAAYLPLRLPVFMPEKPYTYYGQNCDDFLDRIEPFIESRPDVTFYIFSPPYSILFWDHSLRQGNTNAELTAQQYVMEELFRYENVRYFYFQNIEDIITDLDNYRDYSHYSQAINYYMYESMRDGRHEIDYGNYEENLERMRSIIANYDYENIR